MSLKSQYFDLQAQYLEKYGSKAVLLFQVGTFYEIYEYKNDINPDTPNSAPSIGLATAVAHDVGYSLTRCNKNIPHSRENPYLVGIPVTAYETKRDVLLRNDYTIVRYDEVMENGKIERRLAEVISTATDLETEITSSLMAVYIEVQKVVPRIDFQPLICGAANIDLRTGHTSVVETYSQNTNSSDAVQELYRYLISQPVRELIIHVTTPPQNEIALKTFLTRELHLDKYPTLIFNINQLDPNYLNLEYQTEFLTRIHRSIPDPATNLPRRCFSIIEELNLERLNYGRISYIILIQYCYERNTSLTQALTAPNVDWMDSGKFLALTHNAIDQLDILPKPTTHTSLVDILNLTSTSLGYRYLREHLLNPMIDQDAIETYYSMTQSLIDNPIIIPRICDIERYQRKLVATRIVPREISILYAAYKQIYTLHMSVAERPEFVSARIKPDELKILQEFLTTLPGHVHFDHLSETTILGNKLIFKQVPFLQSKFQVLEREVEELRDKLREICHHLSQCISSPKSKAAPLRVESIEYIEKKRKREVPIGFTIPLTSTKAKKVINSSYDHNLCGILEVKQKEKKLTLTSPVILNYFNELSSKIEILETELYLEYIKLVETFRDLIFEKQLNRFLSILDYTASNARIAIRYKYCRPSLISKKSEKSILHLVGFRHPLIERLLNVEYIANDLDLGGSIVSGQDAPNGILLYAINSSGKSSFCKAVALIIMMAQAGMFVPARVMSYTPYHNIITRLSNHDDLHLGQSSFIIEMSEIKTIVMKANANSLVVGDELCKGTETLSALALTAATIQTLLDRQASFILSTHLHRLPSILENKCKGLRIAHLATDYDALSNLLIYDRRLKEGSGPSNYGVLVASYLGLPKEFIELTTQIRNSLTGEGVVVSPNKSRYNTKLYLTACVFCNKRENLHTHHIKEQHEADANGFVGHMHKNNLGNLIPLCEKCHTSLHKNGEKIIVQQTVNGCVFMKAKGEELVDSSDRV